MPSLIDYYQAVTGLAAGKAEWSRPVYAYPDSAVWTGQGDWHDAANWQRAGAGR